MGRGSLGEGRLDPLEERVQAAGETYEAYYLESSPKKYRIWLGTSERKIPLRIDGAVGFGNTSLVMKEYQDKGMNSAALKE